MLHISDDGLARSYAGNGTVLDYVALSPSQLTAAVALTSPSHPSDDVHPNAVWEGVDGRDVTDHDQIWNPPAHLQPFGGFPLHRPAAAGDAGATGPGSVTTGTSEKGDGVRVPRDLPPCAGAPCWTSDECLFKGCSLCIVRDRSLKP